MADPEPGQKLGTSAAQPPAANDCHRAALEGKLLCAVKTVLPEPFGEQAALKGSLLHISQRTAAVGGRLFSRGQIDPLSLCPFQKKGEDGLRLNHRRSQERWRRYHRPLKQFQIYSDGS